MTEHSISESLQKNPQKSPNQEKLKSLINFLDKAKTYAGFKETMKSFMQGVEEKNIEEDIIQSLLNIVIQVKNSPLSENHPFISWLQEQSKRIIDALLSDYMAEFDSLVERYPELFTSKYHRETGILTRCFFMTPEELKHVIEAIKRTKPKEDQKRLLDPPLDQNDELSEVDEIIFTSPIDESTFQRVKHLWSERQRKKDDKNSKNSTQWIIPIKINDRTSAILLFGKGPTPSELLPRSELPMQTVIDALLSDKKSLLYTILDSREWRSELIKKDPNETKNDYFSEEQVREQIEKLWEQISQATQEQWRQVLIRKYRYLEQKGPISDEEIARPAKEHYTREFGKDRGLGEVDVIVTRSGVSANAIAMDLATRWTEEHNADAISTLKGPGWYFENSRSLNNNKVNFLDISCNPDEARIMLIATEPNDPPEHLFKPEAFFETRNSLIKQIAKNAHDNPDRRFALVIDKTTDPEFQAEQLIDSWPPNLRLIETMSLSKHQRGGRNYFYGLVLGHGTHLAEEEKQLLLIRHRGTMTKEGWIGMAKVTMEELVRRQEKIKNVIRECEKDEEFIQGLKERLAWYAYYCFLRIKEGKDYNLSEIVHELKDPTIEVGDSFGLERTRVIMFNNKYIRISPGAKTSSEQIKKLIQRLAED